MDVATRFGSQGLFVKQVKSARFWAIDWPILVLGFALPIPVLWFFGPRFEGKGGQNVPLRVAIAAGVFAAVVAALPLQMTRLAVRVRPRLPDWKTAAAYGVLTMIGKWANVIGQHQYRRDRSAGRNTRLIEYKSPCATPITKPT